MEAIHNDESFRHMKIKRLVQEIRVIAVCEFQHQDGTQDVNERLIIIDSIQRPLPIPYNETL